MPTTSIAAFCFVLLTAVSYAAESELPPVATPKTDGFVSGKFIYELENRPTPECHASTIVESTHGLVAAWFAGTEEKDPDVGIWVSMHDGFNWSAPKKVVDGSEGEDKEYACWNPVLFQPTSGPLTLFYKVGLTPRLWWGVVITSEDGGKTWSKPRKLGTDNALPEKNRNLLGPVKNKPVVLQDGSLLCGSSTENDGWRVHFERSQDRGKTWEVIGPINDASKFNVIQPSILFHPNNTLQILCRSQEKVVAQSWSHDGGRTWEDLTPTTLPNPSAGTDAVTLKDGRHLIVYNHTTRGRHRLNIAISAEGKAWKTVLSLENQPGEFSYPAVIQSKDGLVHSTYTWKRQTVKHVVIDPAML